MAIIYLKADVHVQQALICPMNGGKSASDFRHFSPVKRCQRKCAVPSQGLTQSQCVCERCREKRDSNTHSNWGEEATAPKREKERERRRDIARTHTHTHTHTRI